MPYNIVREGEFWLCDIDYLETLAARIFDSADNAPLTPLPSWYLYGSAVHTTGTDALRLLADWPPDIAQLHLNIWAANRELRNAE